MVLRFKPTGLVASLSMAALALTSCGDSTPPQGPSAGSPAAPAAKTSPAATSSSPAAGGKTVTLSGAGASFPAPLYQRWFAEYKKANPAVEISYQSVGSGAGVKQFLAKTVDFGASDDPLKAEDRSKYPAALGQPVQVPMTGGAVVMAYNLQGIDGLKLSREALCGIVQGEVKTWNDPKIAKDNAGIKLPDSPVTFVHRSDGSGTTAIFTGHIAKACPDWKAGAGKSIEWPTGTGAKGNEGVTAQVQQTPGAIGYTEYSYAKQNGLKSATLQNKSGDFVAPSPEATAKAFEGVQLPEDFALKVPDPEAKGAYPIVGLTWLLLYGQYEDPTKAEALKNMIKWAYADGKKYAEELGYLPLPQEISGKALAALDTIKVAAK